MIRHISSSGYRFPPDMDLSGLARPIRVDGSTVAHEMARQGYLFSVPALKAMGNPADQAGDTVAHVMLSFGHKLHFTDLVDLGNPAGNWGKTLAHMMASKGHVFTLDEITQLGDPEDSYGRTVACCMAEKGHFFSFAELAQLKDPGKIAYQMIQHSYRLFTVDQILQLGDARGSENAISLGMAEHGHAFRFDEIVRLGNPADRFGNTLAHWSARNGARFTIAELLRLQNPRIKYDSISLYYEDSDPNPICRYIRYAGATVAHVMASEGHHFNAEEIQALGNPKDNAGLTIADWMAQGEHRSKAVRAG